MLILFLLILLLFVPCSNVHGAYGQNDRPSHTGAWHTNGGNTTSLPNILTLQRTGTCLTNFRFLPDVFNDISKSTQLHPYWITLIITVYSKFRHYLLDHSPVTLDPLAIRTTSWPSCQRTNQMTEMAGWEIHTKQYHWTECRTVKLTNRDTIQEIPTSVIWNQTYAFQITTFKGKIWLCDHEKSLFVDRTKL